MSGKAVGTLSDRIKRGSFKGVRFLALEKAEVQTSTGTQSVSLIPEDLIADWIVKDNPEVASKLLMLGVRVYLHEAAGYKVTSTAVEPVHVKKLSAHALAVEKTDAIAHIQYTLGEENPRLTQFLIDLAISDVMQQPVIGEPRLRGVVEIAEDMNCPVTYNNRSQLGKFVKSQCSDLAKQEERLVNGRMTKVYCYPDVERVRNAITRFFTV